MFTTRPTLIGSRTLFAPTYITRRYASIGYMSPKYINTNNNNINKINNINIINNNNNNNTMMSTALTLQIQKRGLTSQFIPNITTHLTQFTGCTQLSTLLYSPIGTLLLIVLAYNVIVIGTKHVTYTMEITGKDYVQDQQLHMIMKYGILSCVLLAMEVMFVEV